MRVHLSFGSGLRQKTVATAFHKGLAVIGWNYEPRPLDADVIVGWGGTPGHMSLMQHCRTNGKKFLLVDLGYWNRLSLKDARDACYKITINGLHPNDYMKTCYGGKRYNGPSILPWRRGGDYILFAGMGAKGCKMYGFKHGQWDAEAVRILREHTDLPIIYRQKPSDREPLRIDGAGYDNGQRPIAQLLQNAHALVTHHGNSALDALWAGVPCFAAHGPGVMGGSSDLTQIMEPNYSVDRAALFDQLSWFNWRYSDIMTGKVFEHLQGRGVI